MFVNYTSLEEKIFRGVKKYFEKIPAIGSDDCANAFEDLKSQYGAGGQDYMLCQDLFDDLIESTVKKEFEKLALDEQTNLKKDYEQSHLENYYDESANAFIYDINNLSLIISGRFKEWINDNFQSNNEEDGDDEYEYNVLTIADAPLNFCLNFMDLIGDPALDKFKELILIPGEIEGEIQIKISTNHLDYYLEHDFQLQLTIDQESLSIWSSCLSTELNISHYFFYHAHASGVEEVKGNMNKVEEWLNEKFLQSGIREMLSIKHNLPLD